MRGWVLLLSGTVLGALCGCGHNPNHGIGRAQALAAARRIHSAFPRIPPNFKGAVHFKGPHGENFFLSRGPSPAGGPAGHPGGMVITAPAPGGNAPAPGR
jgi:hypothetical protein